MKTLLVPIKFTTASRHAAEYALQLAKATGSTIYLLHVYHDPIPATVGAVPWTATVSDLREKKELRMQQEQKFLSEKFGVVVEGKAQPGFKLHSIKKAAKEKDADLIVVGLENSAKINGNTVSRLIRRVRKPLLVVPENAPLVALKNIVLAIDFQYLSNQSCFDPLYDVINAVDASLSVIHVEPRGKDGTGKQVPAKLEIGRLLSKFTYVYDKLESDDTAGAIIKFMRDHPADLLVTVAHSHPDIWRPFLSLTIDAVLRKTDIPVLILEGEAY